MNDDTRQREPMKDRTNEEGLTALCRSREGRPSRRRRQAEAWTRAVTERSMEPLKQEP